MSEWRLPWPHPPETDEILGTQRFAALLREGRGRGERSAKNPRSGPSGKPFPPRLRSSRSGVPPRDRCLPLDGDLREKEKAPLDGVVWVRVFVVRSGDYAWCSFYVHPSCDVYNILLPGGGKKMKVAEISLHPVAVGQVLASCVLANSLTLLG